MNSQFLVKTKLKRFCLIVIAALAAVSLFGALAAFSLGSEAEPTTSVVGGGYAQDFNVANDGEEVLPAADASAGPVVNNSDSTAGDGFTAETAVPSPDSSASLEAVTLASQSNLEDVTETPYMAGFLSLLSSEPEGSTRYLVMPGFVSNLPYQSLEYALPESDYESWLSGNSSLGDSTIKFAAYQTPLPITEKWRAVPLVPHLSLEPEMNSSLEDYLMSQAGQWQTSGWEDSPLGRFYESGELGDCQAVSEVETRCIWAGAQDCDDLGVEGAVQESQSSDAGISYVGADEAPGFVSPNGQNSSTDSSSGYEAERLNTPVIWPWQSEQPFVPDVGDGDYGQSSPQPEAFTDYQSQDLEPVAPTAGINSAPDENFTATEEKGSANG